MCIQYHKIAEIKDLLIKHNTCIFERIVLVKLNGAIVIRSYSMVIALKYAYHLSSPLMLFHDQINSSLREVMVGIFPNS